MCLSAFVWGGMFASANRGSCDGRFCRLAERKNGFINLTEPLLNLHGKLA
jgi:hypothetical protein